MNRSENQKELTMCSVSSQGNARWWQAVSLNSCVCTYVHMNEQIFNLLYGLICRLASKQAPLRRVYSHIASNVSQMESLSLTMIDDECCDTESKAWSITLKSSSRRLPPPAAAATAAAVASSTAAEPQMRPSLHTAVELDAAG